MNRIKIIYETDEGHHCTKYQNNKKSMLVYLTEKWIEKKREKEEIEIEDTSDTEWYWFSLVSIGGRIIEEPETREKVFSDLKNKE